MSITLRESFYFQEQRNLNFQGKRILIRLIFVTLFYSITSIIFRAFILKKPTSPFIFPINWEKSSALSESLLSRQSIS
jgi:hypothetical protein